jgi:hypothetical protein
VLWASTVWGARPLDTEDAEILPPGAVELELGGSFIYDSAEQAWVGRAALNVGVLPGLELSIQQLGVVLDPDGEPASAGLGDTLLTLKYRPFKETDPWPTVAGGVLVLLPTGDDDRGLAQGDVEVGPLLILAKRAGPVTLTSNAGYIFVPADRDRDFWLLALSAEYPVSRTVGLVGEVVSTLPAHRGPNRAILRTGVVYAVSPRISLDAAAAVGISRGDLILTTGLTFRLF